MRKAITIIRLLSDIKNTRERLDDLYFSFINPDSEKTCLVTLYTPLTNKTVNGVDHEIVTKNIKDIDSLINKTIRHLRDLLAIKEQYNAETTISIKDIDGSIRDFTIAQLLAMKSDKIKHYYLDYASKLESDKETVKTALAEYNKTVLSNDKIERYVLAKMGSLNINTMGSDYRSNYDSYAKEYIEANKIEILDPLHVFDNIENMKKSITEFYNTIDLKLLEHNSMSYIIVEMHDDGSVNWVRD